MTTTAKALYEAVVTEVNAGLDSVIEYDTTDLDGTRGMTILDIDTDINLDAFSNYKVRDALLVASNENENFAFVLTNKVIKKAKQEYDDEKATQATIEAIATVAHINAMWEQEDNALHGLSLCENLAEELSLEVPTINDSTKKILMVGGLGIRDIAELRAEMVKELKEELLSDLDSE